MNEELNIQRNYWDKSVQSFDSIYSHHKNKFANWLDKKFRWDMYARFNYTVEKSKPIHGKYILDVGCGTGQYSLEFVRQGAQKVIGIDISENMINVCNDRVKKEQLSDRCEFFVGDLIGFKSEKKFDIVIGIGLFDYISKPLDVLEKMNKISNDKVIVSFPRSFTWRSLLRKIRLWIKGCPVYFFSQKQVDQLLKKAGFNRYESEIIGQLFCITAYINS